MTNVTITSAEIQQQVSAASLLPHFLATPSGEQSFGRVAEFRRRAAEVPDRIREIETELRPLREGQAELLINDPEQAKKARLRIATLQAELDEAREMAPALRAVVEREAASAERAFRADGRTRVVGTLLDIRQNAVARIHELLCEIGELNQAVDEVSKIAQSHDLHLANALTFAGVNSLDVDLWLGRVRRLGIPLPPRRVPASVSSNATAIQRRQDFELVGRAQHAEQVHKPELSGLRAQVRNITTVFENFVGRRRA